MKTASIDLNIPLHDVRRQKIAIFEPYVFNKVYGNARYISMYFKFIDRVQFDPILISPIECEYLETLGNRDGQ